MQKNTPKELKDIKNLHNNIVAIKNHANEIVFGQEKVIDKIIITLLSGVCPPDNYHLIIWRTYSFSRFTRFS